MTRPFLRTWLGFTSLFYLLFGVGLIIITLYMGMFDFEVFLDILPLFVMSFILFIVRESIPPYYGGKETRYGINYK